MLSDLCSRDLLIIYHLILEIDSFLSPLRAKSYILQPNMLHFTKILQKHMINLFNYYFVKSKATVM